MERGIALTTAAAPIGVSCQALISSMTTRNRAPIRLAESSSRARLAVTGSSSDGGRSASAVDLPVSLAADDHHRDRSHGGDRSLGEEDRAPVEQLREDATRRGADRSADRGGRRPAVQRGIAAAGRPREHRQRGGEHERAAHALHAAQGDEQAQRARGSATDRGEAEDDQPGHQRRR